MKKLAEIVKKNSGFILTLLGVFIGLCIFFINVHPIVPYDGDDWLLFSQFRHAVPMTGYWNPSRVFQGIFYPLMGMISAFIVYPLTNDYLFSFAVTLALFLAFSFTFLYASLYKLFLSVSKNRIISAAGCLLVLIFYFGFFKSKYNSVYMLYALNYTCVVCYILPGLLNSILVSILLRYQIKNVEILPEKTGKLKFGFLLLFSYLAVFSILFESIILAGYCLLYIVFTVIREKKYDAKKLAYYSFVVFGFLVYCIFEVTGARAGADTINTFALNGSTSFFQRMIIGVETSGQLFGQINPVFLVFSVLIFAGAVGLAAVRFIGSKKLSLDLPGLITLILVPGSYAVIIIISAYAGALFYPQFLMVMYGVFFYYFLLAAFSLIRILEVKKISLIFVPLVFLFFSNELLNGNYRFNDQFSYFWTDQTLSTAKKMELTNDWINQVKEADVTGRWEVTLFVPDYPNHNDMPHPGGYWATSFSAALYIHRITKRYISVNIEYADGILPGNFFPEESALDKPE